jgi:hypothetical protein
LSTIRPAYAQYAVTGILLLSWVTALPAYYRQPGIEDWKSATMYMHRHLQAADTIIVNNPAYRPILEYSFPEFGLVLPTPHVASGPARRISPLESTHIWLLLCHAAPSEIEDVASLKRHFVLLADEHFIGIEVIEFVRQTPAKTP